MRRLLWALLIGLALALLTIALRPGFDAANVLTDPDTTSLLMKIGALVLIGGSVLTIFRERFTHALESLVAWVIIGLLLVLGYTYRLELRGIYEQVMMELVPGRTVTQGQSVTLVRASTGEFQIAADVNGTRLAMVLDTGASSVVLTNDAAKAAGLPLEFIKYTIDVDTANGRTRAASVTIDRIAIGGIVERQVSALIAQPGQLRTSLLGMSFLSRLQSWEVRGDKLILRGQP